MLTETSPIGLSACGRFRVSTATLMRSATSRAPPLVGVRQNHHELLTAEAAARVTRTQERTLHRDGDRREGLVPREMPVPVVVGLEQVDVDDQQGQRLPATGGVRHAAPRSSASRRRLGSPVNGSVYAIEDDSSARVRSPSCSSRSEVTSRISPTTRWSRVAPPPERRSCAANHRQEPSA